jgi:hypothetical protein
MIQQLLQNALLPLTLILQLGSDHQLAANDSTIAFDLQIRCFDPRRSDL